MEPRIEDSILRVMFETAPDAVIVFDEDTLELLDVNPAACAMLGFSRDELRGMSLADVSAEPEDAAVSVAERQSRIPRRLMRRKNGTVFPTDVSVSHVIVGGRMMGVESLRDITEQEHASEALTASEAKFAAAFHTSPDSVNINRLRDGLYLEVNEGFTQLTGFAEADIAGKTSLDTNIWADPADRARLVEGLQSRGWVDNLEARFRMKDGGTRWGLMSARVIKLDGEPCILSVTRDISERRRMEEQLRHSNEDLAHMSRDVTLAMGRIVEVRDPYTQGHQQRVAKVAVAIGVEMQLSEDDLAAIETAGLVHDIGKLHVPTEILTKPGRLSVAEMELVRTHARAGYEILKGVAFAWPVADIVLQHHERMDGSGYPDGVRGDEISLFGRILAVSDVVEAMASHRPYRPAIGLESAIAEIEEHAELYDPDVVGACCALYRRGELEL